MEDFLKIVDDNCSQIEDNIDSYSPEEIDLKYSILEKIYNDSLKLVEIFKFSDSESYLIFLKIRNRIDDCMQLLYDKVFPPFSGLTQEEISDKRKKLLPLLDLDKKNEKKL